MLRRVVCLGFFLSAVLAISSCSSSGGDSEAAAVSEPSGARISSLGDGNNPFAFNQTDVQSSNEGAITGGKRSRYDKKAESAYAAANSGTPGYLKKSVIQKKWSGSKDFSTGSYQTSSFQDSGKKSRWGRKKSREGDQVARASGQSFKTGSFRTGSANEAGQRVATGTNAYVQNRTADGWGRSPTILSEKQYRSLSVGQAKSLLGR